MVNLQKRKEEVIHNIEEQGLLTTELKSDILKAYNNISQRLFSIVFTKAFDNNTIFSST
jgi:hypothetical protein